jgi:alkylation response protein AidB-like acyl-CoA dehydrogenase
MTFPEEFGGAGATLFDLGLAYREAGRALVPTTFNSTILAGMLIAHAATVEQKQRLLNRLSEGDLIATVALCEPLVHENFDLLEMTAHQVEEGWVLQGRKSFVANATTSEIIVVLAKIGNPNATTFGLFVVPSATASLRFDPYLTFGQDALYEVVFDDCVLPHDALLGGPEAISPWRTLCAEVLEVTRALRCMEMLGGIESVLERTVTYVTQRHQFGVPIGSFQAVQHHLANIAMRLEAGRVAAFRALWSVSARGVSSRESMIAELWLSKTYVEATLIAHQVWGGAGYALESCLYLWSERAKTLDLVSGRKALRLEQILSGSAHT